MPFFFKCRRSAVRDAKHYATLIEQLGIPFVITIDHAVVAGDTLGQNLLPLCEAQEAQNRTVIWFDENGYDHHFRCTTRTVNYKQFVGILWLFYEDTENQRNIDDLEGRTKHLEAKQRNYSEALDNLTFPVWIEGNGHQVYYHNKSYESYFENTVPQNIKDVLHESLTTGSFLKRVLGTIVGGERRQLEIKAQPLSANRVLVWTPDRSDYVEEIAVRDRLLSARDRLLEQLHTAVAMFNQDEVLTFYNTAYARLWDLDESYLNTKPTLSAILDQLREQRRLPEQADFRTYKNEWLRLFTDLLAAKEDMMYLPDGRTLRLLMVPNPSGGLLITFEDVTNTLELESSLNTLMAVQRETLDNMTEAIAVYGEDGRLKLWNPQYAALWGFHPEDLYGDPHISSLITTKIKILPKQNEEQGRIKILNLALERKEDSGRFILNDDRYINYASVPLPDGATLLTFDDVTNSFKVEQALRDRATAMEEAEKLKIDFLANVSYQLRTPLNAIIGFSELLEQKYFGDLNEKQMEYASGIMESGQKLLSLVDDILDLSSIEAGYLSVSFDVVDVGSMVKNVYHLTEEWARKSQHRYALIIQTDDAVVDGDERRLKQALINLIRNAITFTPSGGDIEVGVKRSGDECHIWVHDTGIGISQDGLNRIFEPFARIEDADGHYNNGAGLGLSLVKSIVDLHKGHVVVDSQPNQGTRITMVIPAPIKI